MGLSKRDAAFEAFYENLADKGGIGGRELMRNAWEAGRRYEVERVDAIARHRATLTSREDDRGEGAM